MGFELATTCHLLKIPIFDKHIHFGVGEAFAQWVVLRGMDKDTTWTHGNAGIFGCEPDEDGVVSYYIWLMDGFQDEHLWHEALHATCRILKDLGIPVSYKNDEALCFLQGYIATNMLKVLR